MPHGDIEVLADNLWRVEGVMNPYNKRVMTLVRLGDGRIVIHNAIALDGEKMAKIDAWGDVSSILVPNRFHRLDAAIMAARYPRAKAYAPSGALGSAAAATPIAGTYADVPTDDTLALRDLDGVAAREGVLTVRSADGVSAIFCDTVLNLPLLSGIFGVLMHPTGTLAVPRPTSLWFAKDRPALRADLLRVAAQEGLCRVIPGHGDVVSTDASGRLTAAAERL